MDLQEDFKEETGIYSYNELDKKYKIEYILWLEERIEQFAIKDVSHRRELLIDFYSKQRGGINETNKDAIIREVDNYLSINCG